MITIEVKVSSIWISPFYFYKKNNSDNITESTCSKLQMTFTDWEEVLGKPGLRYPVFNFTFCYDNENKIFKVPRGFGVDKIKNMLEKENLNDQIEIIYKENAFYPVRKVNIPLLEGVKPRSQIQQDAIMFLTNTKESGKFLSLATGFGKTFCVIYSAYLKQVPFLIITSKLSKQWIEQIKKFTGINDSMIYEIRGKESIDALMKMKNPRHAFYVCSTNTLYSRMKTDFNLDKVFSHLGIGVKVFDEAHEFYKTNCEIDCNSNFKETYYLTATPMRSDTTENRRYAKMFFEIPMHGVETHYTNNNYTIYLINFNSYPSSLELKKAMRWRRNMLNAHIYAKQVLKNDKKCILYFGMIKMYIEKVRSVTNGKIMIVLTSLDQIEKLYQFLSFYNFRKEKIARYDSTVKIKDREESKNADIILTTFGIAYAGLDLQNLSSVFSLSPFHSAIGTSQLLGRLSRNTSDVYFLDFLDEGYPRMNIQRKNRLKELKPRAKRIYRDKVQRNQIYKFLNKLEEERKMHEKDSM